MNCEKEKEKSQQPKSKLETKNNPLRKRNEELRTSCIENETRNEEHGTSQTKLRPKNNPLRKRNEERKIKI